MSLLPQQCLPPTAPLGTVSADGIVHLDVNWYLLIYNLCQNVLGIGGSGGNTGGGTPAGLPASALTELAALDSDVADADAIALRNPISNLYQLLPTEPDPVPYSAIQNALILAQAGIEQDPPHAAQPSAAISPGGSPYAYTAPFDGTVIVTGGSVSAISITRQGTAISTGITVGLFPLSRGDILTVTYSPSAPTMTFLPR